MLKQGEIEKEKVELPNQMDAILELLNEQKTKIANLEARLSKQPDSSAGNLTEIIASTLKAVKASEKEINHGLGGIQIQDIPKEDILENPIMYCVPSFGYVMSDYKKHGHPIAPPYGIKTIYFECQNTVKKGNGKETQIFHTAYYKCESKKVKEWIEDCPLYKIFIFRKEEKMDLLKIKHAVRGAALMGIVNDWNGVKVFQMAPQFGVPHHDDLGVMKAHLALAMLEKEIVNEKSSTKERAGEMAKEALLSNSNTDKSFGEVKK